MLLLQDLEKIMTLSWKNGVLLFCDDEKNGSKDKRKLLASRTSVELYIILSLFFILYSAVILCLVCAP